MFALRPAFVKASSAFRLDRGQLGNVLGATVAPERKLATFDGVTSLRWLAAFAAMSRLGMASASIGPMPENVNSPSHFRLGSFDWSACVAWLGWIGPTGSGSSNDMSVDEYHSLSYENESVGSLYPRCQS